MATSLTKLKIVYKYLLNLIRIRYSVWEYTITILMDLQQASIFELFYWKWTKSAGNCLLIVLISCHFCKQVKAKDKFQNFMVINLDISKQSINDQYIHVHTVKHKISPPIFILPSLKYFVSSSFQFV